MFYPTIDELIFPSLLIWLAAFVACAKITHSIAWGLVLAFLKTAPFTIYFAYFFDGTYTFLDDISYLEVSLKLIDHGITYSSIPEYWDYIINTAGGEHVGYLLYNFFALGSFGVAYSSPVAINASLSCVVAYLGCQLAETEFGLEKYKKHFFILLLFHPDLLAWSSFINIKDVVVLLLHVTTLMAVSRFFNKKIISSLRLGIPSVLLLSVFRFYVPLLIVIALFATLVLSKRIKGKIALGIVSIVFLGVVFSQIGGEMIQYSLGLLRESQSSLIMGLVRAALSPIPFYADPEYEFLNLPALFHWIMAPVTLLGINEVRKYKTLFSLFIIVYFSGFILLYALFEAQQGPRYRVQLDFALALFQFMGILRLLKLHVRRGNKSY